MPNPDPNPPMPEPSATEASPSATPNEASVAPDRADPPVEGETISSGEPGASGGVPEQGAPRKRKRRRRKKGAHAGPPSTGPIVEGADADAKDGSPGEAAGSEPKAADGAPGAPQAPRAKKPDGHRDAKKSSRRQRDRERAPKGESRERERPAFGLGDVVFGKIIEITDEALFVDLSGKARAIFDRREMDLPDEPPDAPPVKEEPEEEETPEASASAPEPPSAAASDSTLDSSTSTSTSTTSDPTSTSTPTDGSETPERTSHRRIIVAKAIASGALDEPPPPPAPEAGLLAKAFAAILGDAPASIADDAPVVPPGEDIESSALTLRPPPPPQEAPAPRTAHYAPPIVLEMGAHFVGLVHNDGARGGLLVLTRHPHRISKAKLAAVAAFKEKKIIQGLVTGVVKGGVEVDLDGLRAFAPGSHMDMRLGADLHHLIGQRLDFLVTQYGKRGRDCVLSRRPMIEAEAKSHRQDALGKLTPGSVVSGVVKSVVSFGAFIDVGGVEGLVSLPEMSHNRGDSPSDVFKAGETVDVKIIRVDEKGKVWLSRKAAVMDPWMEAVKKYAVGTRHTGKVARLQPFGAFIELENGIDGLIHLADLTLKRVEHPSEVVKIGDPIEVIVSQVDGGSHKIALHPAPSGATADEPPQRVQIHKPCKVQVVAVESGGLVVRILGVTGRNSRGFITSAATGTARGTELRKPFPVGTKLEAKVIEIDPRRGEVKLSIKALHEETERTAYKQYRDQVKQEAKFGTLGDLLAKKLQK